MFALVLEGAGAGPELHHQVEGLDHLVAVFARGPVDAEELAIRRQAAGADAHHEAPAGNMVEPADPMRELGREMIGQQIGAGAEADALGLDQGLGDQDVGTGQRLAPGGEMLAHPGLVEADPIGEFEGVEVMGMPLRIGAMRRMVGHEEHSEFHGRPPSAAAFPATGVVHQQEISSSP